MICRISGLAACLLLACLGCRMPDHPYKCCNGLIHEQYPQNCDLYARAGSVLSPTFGPDFSGEVRKMKPVKKTEETTAPEPLSDLLESNKSGAKPSADPDALMPKEPPEGLPSDIAPPRTAPGDEPRKMNTAPKNNSSRRDREAMRPMVSARQMAR